MANININNLLPHQQKATESICKVFEDILSHSHNHKEILEFNDQKIKENIQKIHKNNNIINSSITSFHEINERKLLQLDVQMETGTGKTITFLNTIYSLYKEYGLIKFIILVPSIAILENTKSAINNTKDFFKIKYETQLDFFIADSKSNESVYQNYISNENQQPSVLIVNHQSYNKTKNTMNKKKEQNINLFTQKNKKLTSYMEDIATLEPVIIIDEPHRAKGDQTINSMVCFNPKFIINYGATFEKGQQKNLIYKLDMLESYKQKLIKGIQVNTIDIAGYETHSLNYTYKKCSTKANITYIDKNDKKIIKSVKTGDSLKAISDKYNHFIIKKINKEYIESTDGKKIYPGEIADKSLDEEYKASLLKETIEIHFQREEELFKQGIKSISLIFVNNSNNIIKDNQSKGNILIKFEELYKEKLQKILNNKNLDQNYKKYLEKENDTNYYSYYFSKLTKKEKDNKKIELMKNRENLLSLSNNKKFIFSQWALREGWDLPNVFTICKLEPSDSETTKIQQIGRGLRLAVKENNGKFERIKDDPNINILNIIVPKTEEDFVKELQKEIIQKFSVQYLIDAKICNNNSNAYQCIQILEETSIISFNKETDIISINENCISDNIIAELSENQNITKVADTKKLISFLTKKYKDQKEVGRCVNHKNNLKIKINTEKFDNDFKKLWKSINLVSKYSYNIDEENILDIISPNNDFLKEKLQEISKTTITKQKTSFNRDNPNKLITESKETVTTTEEIYSYSISNFIKEVSQQTKISYKTILEFIKQIPITQLKFIKNNNKKALKIIIDFINSKLYEKIIQKIKFEFPNINSNEIIINNNIRTLDYSLFIDEKDEVKKEIETEKFGNMQYEKIDDINENIKNKCLLQTIGYDSAIEKNTIANSNINTITVFTKLPRMKIPLFHSTNYSPDFAYVIRKSDNTMFLILETKGYADESKLRTDEKDKITIAKKYFNNLQQELKKQNINININYKTCFNKDTLEDIINGLYNIN